MTDQETLHFKIELAGTYWDKQPQYSILLNDDLIKTDTITAASGDSVFVEFDHAVDEGSVSLSVRLENKTDTDTVENADKTAIEKDMLLHIRSVEIDEIDLGNMIWSKSQYVGNDAGRPVLDNCVDLGWNGTWTLAFDSPFYIWLLENI
jgi:hypothetical protein